MGIGLKKSDQEKGSFYQGGRALLTGFEFVIWDYMGKGPKGPALHVTIKPEDEEEDVEQYFSCGKLEHLRPSKDGKSLEPVAGSKRAGLSDSSNAGIFLGSLMEAGFPEDKVEDDVTIFDNTEVELARVAQPKRTGLPQGGVTGKKDEPERERTVLKVSEIYSFPWDKKSKGKDGASIKVKAKAKDADEDDDDDDDDDEEAAVINKTIATIKTVLKANGEMTRNALSKAVFKEAKADDDVKKMVDLTYDDEFMEDDERPWAVDGADVTFKTKKK